MIKNWLENFFKVSPLMVENGTSVHSGGTYECGGDAHALGSREGRAEVVPLVARGQRVVGHARGQVSVQQGAQGQPVIPGGAKQQTNCTNVLNCKI